MAEETILERDICHDMRSSYLDYALDVIVGRAIPDVRDGCKPVHRRILYSMYDTGNVYKNPHKKSARTVGEVLGKYHPHGDSSVYDAMVRLAQPFNVRYPFVDGHGNFGSIDGDPAAAMRYTEARMSRLAEAMMEDIDKNTVDTMPNYDGTLQEPKLLPSLLPNLLLNGAEGIAVGYATKIPTHNLTECMNGIMAQIDNPEISIEELMEYIKAPDFPTGGTIMGLDGVKEAYVTGSGKIKVRAKYDVEDNPHNSAKKMIVFTEIPYQVNKSMLVSSIHALMLDKVIDGIDAVRDESSVREGTGIRIVVELKKGANIDKILRQLFRKTKLEDDFPVKLLAVVPTKNGNLKPKLLNLKQILAYYIEHRKNVVTRKYQYLLAKAKARCHILDGFIKAVNIIDDVVATIRKSESVEDARNSLISSFDFSEKQASAILEFKLQKLVGLEIKKLKDEREETLKNIKTYNNILSSEANIMKEIKKDCEMVITKYGDDRRTDIVAHFKKDNLSDLENEVEKIPEQNVVVVITNTGYIKRVPLEAYSSQKRGGKGVKGNANSMDAITNLITTTTKKTLLCFDNVGKMHKLAVVEIPEDSKTGRGKFLNSLIGADSDAKIVAVTEVDFNEKSGYLLMFSRLGGVKRINVSDLMTSRRSVIAINIRNEEDALINVCHIKEGDSGKAFISTSQGKLLCFDASSLRSRGRNSGTQRGIKLKGDDFVVGADTIRDNCLLLTVLSSGYGKRCDLENYSFHNIGGSGMKNANLKKDETVVATINVNADDDILVVSSNSKVIRTDSSAITPTSRTARGVKLIKLDTDEYISSVCSAQKEDVEDTEEETEE